MADMSRRPEAAPGSTESLYGLYDLVPASEEIDLAEEAAREQVRSRIRDHLAAQEQIASADVDETIPGEAGAENLSEGQVRGLLEHLLGAEPVDEDPPAED